MSINKVILVGNVGKDPVVRYFDRGVAKATFPLATSETYTNQQGETITSTEWHNIVLWRSLAEVAEKTVKKGTQLYIVGKIKTRSYVDKDGNNKYITEILADTMLVLEKKQGAGNTYDTTQNTEKTQGEVTEAGEPDSAYRQKNESDDTGSIKADPFNDTPGGVQSEDDLPF
ncbi:MAG: single-stranded DNA-binding protein [Bacteroidales bacterium]|nr:single-stranded DNA-binding protein [Bacteroidales bacterium]MBN2632713.1 single-stranded DNA-binding protein [Bacteroidales bacterium]